MGEKDCRIMVSRHDAGNGPVMKAATMALETGNANCIPIRIKEESDNTLKNLLKKICCERNARKNMLNRADDWYFETVNPLHYAFGWLRFLCMTSELPDEKPIVLMAAKKQLKPVILRKHQRYSLCSD